MMFYVANLYYFNKNKEKGRKLYNKLRDGYFKEGINGFIEDGEIVLK